MSLETYWLVVPLVGIGLSAFGWAWLWLMRHREAKAVSKAAELEDDVRPA